MLPFAGGSTFIFILTIPNLIGNNLPSIVLELYILPVIIRIRKGETTMNEPKHMLITYSSEKAESGHVDPNFTKLVYGNSKRTGNN